MNRPNKKNLTMWFFLITLLFIVLNALAYYAIKITLDVSMYHSESYGETKRFFKKPKKDFTFVHPYVGKIVINDKTLTSDLSSEPLFETIYQSPNQENEIKVLILGGSVAGHLSQHYEAPKINIIARKLNNYFETNRFSVFNAAFGGGKQPQQYLKLVYLDLLGFKPDIVINYDGFNEIALPLAENLEIKNAPIYPRSYSRHIFSSASSRGCVTPNNYILSFNTHVPIAELAGWVFVWYCHNKIIGNPSPPWWSEKVNDVSDAEFLRQTLSIWSESSNKLYLFAKERNIDYIHVLQPNQYYKGSKILSPEEKLDALGHPFLGKPIEKYYKLLSGEQILAENFKDHRFIFSDISETLYSDNCCHLNFKGMELIVDDIVTSFAHIFRKHLEQ